MNAVSAPPQLETHLANLDRALQNLVEFLSESRRPPVVLAGITKAFEYTYELSWTACEKIAHANGLQTGGPRPALGLGLIEDQDLWLSMMRARNLSSHTYNKGVAEDLVTRIESAFLPEFQKVRKRLSELVA
jgi:nucleotidyltransferase substrate binding protein (TIGR01987 family)